MTRLGFSMVADVACLAVGAAQRSDAQQVVYFAPTAPVVQTAFFAPPVVQSAIVAPAPVVQTTFYAPATTSCCAPTVVAAPTVTYFRAPQVVYQPVPTLVTRNRPILGGT